ncbi:MAG: potassium-transporting ATPase subunit KdpA, partial [Proteobacteria bacterium]
MSLVAYALYFAVLLGAGWLLAGPMARIFAGEMPSAFLKVENGLLRASGVDAVRGMSWGGYALSLLAFNLAGFLLLYAILRVQGSLPLNPDGIGGMAPDLAFNTAVSFVTNTNWQAYTGEAQLSYLSQMAGLTVQNFVSAGTGMAVAVAVIRGFVLPKGSSIGNFWVDMTRSVLWVLLPLSVLLALFLAWQGVPQT